jgi:ABC-2 type transport system permease protein
MSMGLSYTLVSTRSTFRNTSFVLFTLALPLVMYLLFNNLYGSDRDVQNGITTSAYLMVSMAAYGGMGAAINAGARVAIERQTGWNRQLRLSALSPRAYLVSKSAVSLVVALPAIILVFLAGALIGHVHMPVPIWLGAGLGIWLAMIPFAVAGLVIGSVARVEAVQPITTLVYIGMSILGGLWFPVDQLSPFLRGVAKVLPSYWVGETGRTVLGRLSLPVHGVVVLAAWTVGLGLIGVLAYRRSGRKR